MLINIRIAFRHLWKNKLFSIINILGLSLGLACCFIILLHVKFELSYDQFHSKKDRIIRVLHNNFSYTPIIMTSLLPEYFPEIESITRIGKYDWVKFYVVQNQTFTEEKDFVFADSTFFNIFSFPILTGNPNRILRSPDKIMLSENVARKYFGNDNPEGKIITLRLMNRTYHLSVEGVFRNFPEQSHFHANFLVSFKFFAKEDGAGMLSNWGSNSVQTYILLKESTRMERMTPRIQGFIDKYVPKDNSKNLHYSFQQLTRIHLYSDTKYDIEPQGNITRVIVFISIALLVLIIAVANFVLLSLALSYQRIKEFGIRKIVGAKIQELVSLVSAEFFIVFVLALQIALMLVEILIPLVKNNMNLTIDHGISANIVLLILFIVLVVLLGYLACIYITIHVAQFRPVDALKNNVPLSAKRIPSRGVLVVFQFMIMIGLLSCLLIMNRQLNLIRNKDLGFRKEQLLSVDIPVPLIFEVSTAKAEINNFNRLKTNIKSLPEVINVSRAAYLPPSNQWWVNSLKNPLTNEKFDLEEINVDYDLIETLGIQMSQGRSFSREFAMDSISILLNETAVKMMSLKNPLESYLIRDEADPIRSHKKIIGIFKDFHIRSLYDKVQPMVVNLNPAIAHQMAIRLSPQANKETYQKIENIWKSIFPDDPIQFIFVDEALHANYIREDQSNAIISLFAFLSLVIALMGLFGLSAFTVEKRTKEIGIRKVNGASVTNIFIVLSKQFGKWIGIAFIIATPLSWYAMHSWLQHFAYKTELSWWVFGLSGFISIIVAVLTVSWQTYKAATRNPVEALRYE
jgi:putative ABC transport system permease protein